MKKVFAIALCAMFVVVAATAQKKSAPAFKWDFQNPQLSYAERVENLLSLLTPEEKVGLMMNKSVSVDRLGIRNLYFSGSVVSDKTNAKQ